MKKWEAYKVYLTLQALSALLFAMIFTYSSVYQVTVVNLSALQLVLVGTMLELTVFVFEVPTGVVADVYSRRLSVIIGFLLIVKSRAELFEEQLIPAVKAIHPYEVPEIIALPILMGSKSYLDWIDDSTTT